MTGKPLARSGSTSPLWKLPFPCKVNLPEETGDLLTREARRVGMTQSEFLRELIMLRLHVLDYVRRLYEERLNVVAGNVPEQDLKTQ